MSALCHNVFFFHFMLFSTGRDTEALTNVWKLQSPWTDCSEILRYLFFLVSVRSGWLHQKAPISTSQTTLAGKQRRGLILWKRRFLTWHFPVVWRRLKRDFCELSWLLQINSSSLSLRQLVWHLNQIKQGFPSTSTLRTELFHQIPISWEGYRWDHLNPLLTQL